LQLFPSPLILSEKVSFSWPMSSSCLVPQDVNFCGCLLLHPMFEAFFWTPTVYLL